MPSFEKFEKNSSVHLLLTAILRNLLPLYFKTFLIMKELLQKAKSKKARAWLPPYPSHTLSIHETLYTRIIPQYYCPFLGSALAVLLLSSLTLASSKAPSLMNREENR